MGLLGIMRIGDLRFAPNMVGIGHVCDAIIATDKSRRGFSHGVARSRGAAASKDCGVSRCFASRMDFVLPFVLLSCPLLLPRCDFDFVFTHLITRVVMLSWLIAVPMLESGHGALYPGSDCEPLTIRPAFGSQLYRVRLPFGRRAHCGHAHCSLSGPLFS